MHFPPTDEKEKNWVGGGGGGEGGRGDKKQMDECKKFTLMRGVECGNISISAVYFLTKEVVQEPVV